MLAIYGECGLCKLKELQKIQNQCIKALYRLPRLTSSTYLYSTKLLPIVELAKVGRLTNVHKMVHSLTKHNFTFVHNFDVHGRMMRRFNNIHLFNPYSVNSDSNSALLRAISEYNMLPLEVRESASIGTFNALKKKKKIRKIYCDRLVCSFD